jgi:uncharacterized membrane protein YeaQ/YmgE (transglycosylase-associated protein family)
MSFLTRIVLGLIAGFIGSKVVNHRGEGINLDIILGIVGAVVGGWLFTALGGMPHRVGRRQAEINEDAGDAPDPL